MQGEETVKFTDAQLYKIGTVYNFIARLLPVEGRDYNVIFSFNDKNDPDSIGVSFKYYTELGKFWCDYCSKALSKAR